jgi:hypothetical protein
MYRYFQPTGTPCLFNRYKSTPPASTDQTTRMSPISPSTLFSFLAVSAIAVLAGHARRKQARALNFPPGPKGLPLLGNVLDINTSEPWLTFTQWVASYGSCLTHDASNHADLSRRIKVIWYIVPFLGDRLWSFRPYQLRELYSSSVRIFIQIGHQSGPRKSAYSL